MLEPHLSDKKQPLSLVFAIPDHPWVDTADGAAVRIAMTVAKGGYRDALLSEVVSEREQGDGEVAVTLRGKRGRMFADLKIGADVAGATTLRANFGISNRGVIPHGQGFIVTYDEAKALGLGSVSGLDRHIRPYRNGRDISQFNRDVLVIDLLGMNETEVRHAFPSVYQHLLHTVKPERSENKRTAVREKWWLFAEPRKVMRRAGAGLDRFIVTIQTSKHRFFTFLDSEVLPDDKLIAVASDDAVDLGVLSSQMHAVWALAAGATLEDRPVYNKSTCFEAFPFPDLHAADKFAGPIGVAVVNPDGTTGASETFGDYPSDRIRALGEQLDAHRKRQQAAHPELTLTGMYNVLEKLRSGEVLSARERTIHEQGLVSVLRQIHDELDAAVLGAYGWADLLPLLRIAHGNDNPAEGQSREEARRAFDEAVLERLVALNAERAAEEARGLVRWLRPEFQNPAGVPAGDEQAPRQDELPTDADEPAAVPAAAAKPMPWPKDTVDQVRAVAEVLAAQATPMSVDDIAARFTARGPWKRRLPQLLEMLVALGRAQEQDGRFSPGA